MAQVSKTRVMFDIKSNQIVQNISKIKKIFLSSNFMIFKH